MSDKNKIPLDHHMQKKAEIDCLKVKKVFEECSRTFVAKVKIPVRPPHKGHEVECGKAHITPKSLKCEIEHESSRVLILEKDVTVHVKASLIDDNRNIPVHAHGQLVIPESEREFKLSRAGEEDLDCEVDIFAECLECFISKSTHDGWVSEITCCIGILIIVKLLAEVQLQIPTFGFCPVPPRCKEFPPCPPVYNPTAIPFPKQKKKPPTSPSPTSPPTKCPPKRKTCPCDEPMVDLIY